MIFSAKINAFNNLYVSSSDGRSAITLWEKHVSSIFSSRVPQGLIKLVYSEFSSFYTDHVAIISNDKLYSANHVCVYLKKYIKNNFVMVFK